MRLEEFTAVFTQDYTEEQKRNYSMMYGDDKDQWPETESRARVTIDLYRVIAFNEIKEENRTTVYLETGGSYGIDMPYNQFKNLMLNI